MDYYTNLNKRPPSLEDIYAWELEGATFQNRTLFLRNYFRWKFFDIILGGLRSFLDDEHRNPEKGKSVREITKTLSDRAEDFFQNSEKDEIDALMTKLRAKMKELFEEVFSKSDEAALVAQSAFYGSEKGGCFDAEKFLQTIAKNAVARLLGNLEIQTRKYNERHQGAGYTKARENVRSLEPYWQDPNWKAKMKERFREAWQDNTARKQAAASRAAKQMDDDPEKQQRMQAGRKHNKSGILTA